MKFIKILCILLPLTVIGVGCGAYFWLQSYIQTPAFVKELERIGAKQVKGDLTISNAEVQDWALHSDVISLSDSGVIKQLVIRNLDTRLQFRALLQKVWRLQHLQCQSLVIEIDSEPNQPEQSIPSEEGQDLAPSMMESERSPRQELGGGHQELTRKGVDALENVGDWLTDTFMPTELEFEQINVGEFGGVLRRNGGNFIWKGVSLSGEYRNQSLQLQAKGGQVQTPIEPFAQLALDEMYCSVTEDQFIIQELKASLPVQGDFKVHGEGNFQGEQLDLKAAFADVPLETFLKDRSYSDTITGALDGDLKVAYIDNVAVTDGTVALKDGRLRLPQELSILSHLIGQQSLQGLEINECQTKVIYSEGVTTLDNILINVQNIFFIEGRVTLGEEDYEGAVRVGIPQRIFASLPPIVAQKYQESNGRYFQELNITGPKNQLLNNIKKGLIQEFQASIFDTKEPIQDVLKNQATKLINGEASAEEIKGLLNKGFKALKGFFN